MESVLNKLIVVQLNRNWERIGWRTVKQAIVAMTGGDGEPPALGFDLEYDADGNCVRAVPVPWDEWLKLSVRDTDLGIQTHRGAIRAPLAIICRNYAKMPLKTPRLTKKAILERDGMTCQYTGEKLSRSQANVDHVIPRARGGKDTFENLVTSKRDLNSKKGHKLNEEAGLKLIRKPKAPSPVPMSFVVKEPKHPHHKVFFS